MSMYSDFKTDPTMEQDGIVLDYGTFRVTVARAGGSNKRYLKLLEERSRPHQRAIQSGLFDNERAEELLRGVIAETVVKNWELKNGDAWVQGIEAPDGDTLPFTVPNVLATFNAIPDLFQDIREQSSKGALYRASLREAAAGN